MMLEKLKSRKLIMAVVGILGILATQVLGVPEDIAGPIGDRVVTIVCAYVLGQGVVDATGNLKK